MIIFWPDTRNRPLEEIGAIFGDEEDVAKFTQKVNRDPETISTIHAAQMQQSIGEEKSTSNREVDNVEQVGMMADVSKGDV